MATKKLNGTVIVTYRCNARCTMCNRYKAPSKPEEEISLETIRSSRTMSFRSVRIKGSPPVMLVKYMGGSLRMVSRLISSSGFEGAL